jgi:opacity protein-like surface antigen
MSRLLRGTLLALAAVSVARAQDDRGLTSQSNANVAADFGNSSASLAAPKFSDHLTWTRLEPRFENAAWFAEPRPLLTAPEPLPASPEPKFVYGGRDDFRWQLALGVALVRFRSSAYYATAVGTNTSLTYFTNQWFGVEGNVNTAFAPTIYKNEHVKYLSYGAGPKVAWRARQWEPWVHAIFGGAHVLPKTANNSKNGFALEVGGGVDYRIFPHLSARLELDWVRTHLFGQWQNSGQANADVVLHF